MHTAQREVFVDQEFVDCIVNLPWAAAHIVKQGALLGPHLVGIRHTVNGRKWFGKGSLQHPTSTVDFRLLDGVIYIGNNTNSGPFGQKDRAASLPESIVPALQEFGLFFFAFLARK